MEDHQLNTQRNVPSLIEKPPPGPRRPLREPCQHKDVFDANEHLLHLYGFAVKLSKTFVAFISSNIFYYSPRASPLHTRNTIRQ